MTKRTHIAWLVLLVAGCATEEKKESPAAPLAPAGIDYLAVQRDLGMVESPGWVGYREKRFDACRMSADLPQVPDCARANFVQIGVQLSCRPTQEAQNNFLEQGELTPVGDRDLRWRLGKASGQVRTDSTGHALILAIVAGSMKSKGLRISTGVDFLVMPAGEATNIVTPVSWCN